MIYTEDVFMDSGAKTIPGFSGRYKITREGQIWSNAKKKWRLLKPFVGYPRGTLTRSVSLCNGRKIKVFYVHRLLQRVFGIGPMPDRTQMIPRGLGRYVVTPEGVVWSCSATQSKDPGKWKVVEPIKSRDGYLRIRFRFNGRTTYHFLHRLVLEAFVGPCPKGMEARHFPDANPTNCRLKNLSWGTPKQNAQDKRLCRK